MGLFSRPAVATDQGISVEAAQNAISRGRQDRFAFLQRFLRGKKRGDSLIERNLVTAGLLLKGTEFLMVNIVIAAVVIMLGLLWLRSWSPDPTIIGIIKKFGALLVIVYLGWKGPRMVLQFLADKRRTTLEYQLMDALTIISSGLKGGYAFAQGLQMASDQMDDPIKSEFARVMRFVGLGMAVDRALEDMAHRVNSYDYDMTVSATNITLSVGGNLTTVLEAISQTIRERLRLRREISALTAQGRISGAILVGMPICIAVMLKFINAEYMDYLLTKKMGNNLLVFAGVQQALGILWIKKLLEFD